MYVLYALIVDAIFINGCMLDEWVKQAIESKIQPLMKMASTIRAYKTYILAWYDHYITNGTIEGINNKIKVLKRQIYGFRNEEYFKLGSSVKCVDSYHAVHIILI